MVSKVDTTAQAIELLKQANLLLEEPHPCNEQVIAAKFIRPALDLLADLHGELVADEQKGDEGKAERCPEKDSGGVQCEKPEGHEPPHACPKAAARAYEIREIDPASPE